MLTEVIMLATAILFAALAAPLPPHPATHPAAEPFTTDAVSTQPVVEFTSPADNAMLPFGPVRVVIAAQPANGSTLRRGTLSGAGPTLLQWNYPTEDGGPKVFELTMLTQGTHTLRASITDSSGRPAQAEVTFTLRAPGTDSAAPVVRISAPAGDPVVIAAGSPVTFSGTASDDVALSSVAWQLSGRPPSNGPLSAMGTWSRSFTGLADGRYTFTVIARDHSGKQTTRERLLVVGSGTGPGPGTPPPQAAPDKGGDIVSCGSGSGISALLLLFAPLAALGWRRRIE